MHHRIYYSPGIFGFGSLASYDYFGHVERALESRFHDAGATVSSTVVGELPTASVRRRAGRLAAAIGASCGDDEGPIHLAGLSAPACRRDWWTGLGVGTGDDGRRGRRCTGRCGKRWPRERCRCRGRWGRRCSGTRSVGN